MHKRKIVSVWISIAILAATLICLGVLPPGTQTLTNQNKNPISWVDFNVSYEALHDTMEIDISTYKDKHHVKWIEALSYLGCIYGGDFSKYDKKDLITYSDRISSGITIKKITEDMKHFSYYKQAYGAVLNGMLGEYKIQISDNRSGKSIWQTKYGLKGFYPVAEGFYTSEFNDFGTGRSYGFARKHLGHDIIISTGTPIVAVEGGIVEAIGWNKYGGWRLGIRSYDKKRYYYYAHLRKDFPYAFGIHIGSAVTAGDVIGYSGQTGYSDKENTNNIDTPHLHFGMQLIFSEDQKDDNSEIWIDTYQITRLLASHKSTVIKDGKSGAYKRKYRFSEKNYYLTTKNQVSAKAASSKTLSSEKKKVPVIMYHGLIKDPGLQTKYFISPSRFEEDLIYLRKKGYTSVSMKELVDYTNGIADLPPKPIVLTFDDGYYNNYLYGYPLLKKYGMKAVISIIGKYTDKFSNTSDNNAAYSHITWQQMRKMSKSGLVEFQNHTYDAHEYTSERKGAASKKYETKKEYIRFLKKQLLPLQYKIQKNTGVLPTTFTYPFGAISKSSENIVKQLGFKATLSCREGENIIKKGMPQTLYLMKRYLRSPEKSSPVFFKKIL